MNTAILYLARGEEPQKRSYQVKTIYFLERKHFAIKTFVAKEYIKLYFLLLQKVKIRHLSRG
jgi:hypothetical protein